LKKLVWLSNCSFWNNYFTYNQAPHVMHTFIFFLSLDCLCTPADEGHWSPRMPKIELPRVAMELGSRTAMQLGSRLAVRVRGGTSGAR
jgi:hypothetical protein